MNEEDQIRERKPEKTSNDGWLGFGEAMEMKRNLFLEWEEVFKRDGDEIGEARGLRMGTNTTPPKHLSAIPSLSLCVFRSLGRSQESHHTASTTGASSGSMVATGFSSIQNQRLAPI